MKKTVVRKQLNVAHIGFDPDRMKTVHVANGLLAEILGFYYPTNLMNRLVVFERRQVPEKGTSKYLKWQQHDTRVLLPNLAGKIPTNTTEELLSRLRVHLYQHLDADNGVYDLDDFSGCAYSAVTSLLVTDDRNNDGFSGNFLAFLLKYDFGNGPSPLVEKIVSALNENPDPMSALTYIFTPDEEKPKIEVGTYDKKPREHFSELIAANDELKTLRTCFDRLASYYPSQLSTQRFLRLVVILGSLVLIRYLVILYNKEASLHKNGQTAKLAFLIDAQQNNSSRTRSTSQATYSRVINALIELYSFWLGEWIYELTQTEHQTIQPDIPQIIQTYSNLVKESTEIFPKDAIVPKNVIEGKTPDEVIYQAGLDMASNMLKRRSGDDFIGSFIRDLGIRSGLIKPRSAQQKRKHFDLQADTIEVLILSILEPGVEEEGITLDDFANRLWNTFGMVFGGMGQGSQDFQILTGLGIREANQDDLNQNSDAFIARLVTLGLAREYSDGLVLIQHPS